ncbi:ATP dependent DNA ligase domain-containing protein [Cladochytrium replicatum]|nr:ATP dependent DNA ligase domain-containing protein [Cladochytrium replicatum]
MSLPFSDLVDFLDRLEAKTSRLPVPIPRIPRRNSAQNALDAAKARDSASHAISDFSSFLKAHHPKEPSGPWLRLLIPEIDTRRYGIREKRLAEALVRILGIASTSVHAKRLRSWACEEEPHALDVKIGFGHLDRVVEEVLRGGVGFSTTKRITVKEVDALLTELSTLCEYTTTELGTRPPQPSRSTSDTILRNLFWQRSPRESRWMVLMILRRLPIHLSTQTILYNLHPTLPRLYNTTGTLPILAYHLDTILHENSVPIVPQCIWGHPIRLMEYHRATSVHDCLKHLDGEQRVFAEIKYDGERMQVHYDFENGVRIFSKSLRNSTHDRRRAIPLIEKAFKGVKNCILEGELVVYDDARGKVEEFGGLRDFISIGEKDDRAVEQALKPSSRHLCVVFFDILLLDSIPLLDKPFEKRRSILESTVRITPNRSILSRGEWLEASTSEPLRWFFANTIVENEEGIVVKGALSAYRPGAIPRKGGGNWCKLKRDRIEGFGDTMDVCVVGGSYDPHNSFVRFEEHEVRGMMNRFFIGFLANKEDIMFRSARPLFRILFAIECGFGKALLQRFCRTLERVAASTHPPLRKSVPLSSSTMLDYDYTNESEYAIQWLFPNPRAVEVVGSGFVKDRYQQHYVLRFARFLRECGTDRGWLDMTTFDQLQEISMKAVNCTEKLDDIVARLEAADDRACRSRRAKQPPVAQIPPFRIEDDASKLPTDFSNLDQAAIAEMPMSRRIALGLFGLQRRATVGGGEEVKRKWEGAEMAGGVKRRATAGFINRKGTERLWVLDDSDGSTTTEWEDATWWEDALSSRGDGGFVIPDSEDEDCESRRWMWRDPKCLRSVSQVWFNQAVIERVFVHFLSGATKDQRTMCEAYLTIVQCMDRPHCVRRVNSFEAFLDGVRNDGGEGLWCFVLLVKAEGGEEVGKAVERLWSCCSSRTPRDDGSVAPTRRKVVVLDAASTVKSGADRGWVLWEWNDGKPS